MNSLDPDSFYLTDKPSGISTHRVDADSLGWVEYCQSKLEPERLWVIHRLDKTTSGCVVFAKSSEAANKARLLFEQHQVQKKYLFITDRSSLNDCYQVQGNIIKQGKTFTFEPSNSIEVANSQTHFQRLKRSPYFELWEATPISGKPHQIRLHASFINLPILGDTLYQGSPFPTLCLHAQSIEIAGAIQHQSPPPIYFERLGLLKDPVLIDWLSQLDQRQRVFNFLSSSNMAIRGFEFYHKDSQLILDILGSVAWLHCYPDIPKDPQFQNRIEFLSHIIQRPIKLYQRTNRGASPKAGLKVSDSILPEQWQVNENSYQIELRSNQGAHYGLFLDQRLNRNWVLKNTLNKDVLNLFCYTGGFSVAAAKGGARHITSVDISKTYLDWSKQNFIINQLDHKKHQWIKFDATLFLKKLVTKRINSPGAPPNRFDLIICDPPTFARTTSGVFRLEKEYLNLISQCFEILNPSGQLIFSCNLETLSHDSLLYEVKKTLPPQAKIQFFKEDLDYALGVGFGTSKVLLISNR